MSQQQVSQNASIILSSPAVAMETASPSLDTIVDLTLHTYELHYFELNSALASAQLAIGKAIETAEPGPYRSELVKRLEAVQAALDLADEAVDSVDSLCWEGI